MTEPIKMLFVDDERNVLRSLRRLFIDEARYAIKTAESAEAGLQILSEEDDIRLVMADYRMPEMDGVEFLAKVYERWPRTIRIVLSGYADTAVVVDAINKGQIFKFMPKPWNDEELQNEIAVALELQELQLQNDRLNVELKNKNQQLRDLNEILEQKVAERTEALELRSQVLQIAQNVLDALPLAVFGIDKNQNIVQCNSTAFEILPTAEIGPLGEDRRNVFPADLNTLIDRGETEQESCAIALLGTQKFRAILKRLQGSANQDLVLVLIPA